MEIARPSGHLSSRSERYHNANDWINPNQQNPTKPHFKYQQNLRHLENINKSLMQHLHKVLVTEYGDLGNGYFLDPKQKISFKFDHLSKTVSDIQPCIVENPIESWRTAIESALTSYVKKHYPAGNVTVYGKTYRDQKIITACIESHNFQRNEFWNGFWKSEWKLVHCAPQAEVTGTIKVQVSKSTAVDNQQYHLGDTVHSVFLD
ncbi:F-actin-capping protein subunit alpha-2-like [Pristis pectinata]|uniref:F-actin-capping protein subunit alpha-2-like n=1 Tax=Pristis pectinata TaxID=685728 RepID=UPI00223DF58D|nr:F-actin-capping protein subunit alpha-2-like [Pristis pectinata]